MGAQKPMDKRVAYSALAILQQYSRNSSEVAAVANNQSPPYSRAQTHGTNCYNAKAALPIPSCVYLYIHVRKLFGCIAQYTYTRRHAAADYKRKRYYDLGFARWYCATRDRIYNSRVRADLRKHIRRNICCE